MMWSHYADKHRGICLGFDVPKAMTAAMQYSADRLRIDLDGHLADSSLNDEVVRRLFMTKFVGWQYEDEVRLFVKLKERERRTGLYFAGFGPQLVLKEVILGPRSTLAREDCASHADGQGCESVYCKGTHRLPDIHDDTSAEREARERFGFTKW